MFKQSMPELRIGDLVVPTPIIQGGMGVGISLSGLASAVAESGGVGVISSVAMGLLENGSTSHFRDKNLNRMISEIRKSRALTDGVIGVNIMVAVTDYEDLVKAAFEEQIDIVFLGAGLPLKLPSQLGVEYMQASRTKVGVIVSSGRAARLIYNYWHKNYGMVPDLVVVEGPLAGGHLGFKPEQISDPRFTLEQIVPDVVEVVSRYAQLHDQTIPVIAGGGVYTGEDIHRLLSLGASGVQMGTRFVATKECDASPEFKQAYIDCSEDDIAIIQSPVGLPGRAIRNTYLDGVSAGERKPFRCSWQCLRTCDYKEAPYCIAQALVNAQRGKLNAGFAFAGSNAWRVKDITTVSGLIAELDHGYAKAVKLMLERTELSRSA